MLASVNHLRMPQLAWRPAASAPGEASPTPAESVELSGPQRPTLSPPMLALSRLEGSLGDGLTPELKAGLLPVFQRLHAGGTRFYVVKGNLFGERKSELGPTQLLDHLAGCRAHYLEKLSVKVPGSSEFELNAIGSLAGLEPLVLGPDDALKQALDGLARAGFEKDKARVYAESVLYGQQSIQFYRGGKNKFGDNLETYCTMNLDEVLAVGALAGGSSLDCLAHPELARQLQTACQEGWLGKSDWLHVYRKGEGERIPLEVDSRLPPLKVRGSLLEDLPRARAEAERYQAAYRRYVVPLVTASGASSSLGLHDELHSPDGNLPLEARLESFATLAAHAKHPLSKEIQTLHAELCRECHNAMELQRGASVLASVLKEGDLEGARAALKDLRGTDQGLKPALYEELRAATESHPVAQAGVNLVRIPVFCEGVGAESLETRKAAYTRVATSLSASDRDQAPQVYQELLINRRPDEPLTAAADHLVALVAGCTASGFPMLAPALFEMLQAGPPERMDERIARFSRAATLGSPLQDSLTQLDPRATQSIKVEGDRVTVAGVVLKRRKE